MVSGFGLTVTHNLKKYKPFCGFHHNFYFNLSVKGENNSECWSLAIKPLLSFLRFGFRGRGQFFGGVLPENYIPNTKQIWYLISTKTYSLNLFPYRFWAVWIFRGGGDYRGSLISLIYYHFSFLSICSFNMLKYRNHAENLKFDKCRLHSAFGLVK
jgi:hypothetical protein